SCSWGSHPHHRSSSVLVLNRSGGSSHLPLSYVLIAVRCTRSSIRLRRDLGQRHPQCLVSTRGQRRPPSSPQIHLRGMLRLVHRNGLCFGHIPRLALQLRDVRLAVLRE